MNAVPPSAQVQLSVIVPLYNEEANVAPLHGILSGALAPLAIGYELLFVNDGSADGTGAELERLALVDAHLIVVEHPNRRGKAVALHTALKRASGRFLLIIDGDLQYDPRDIPMLLDTLRAGADVVSGYRTDRQDPLARRLSSRAYNGLLNVLVVGSFQDHFSGIKAFRAEALDRMELDPDLIRFSLVVAKRRGLVVREVPVRHQRREAGASSYGWLALSRLAWTDLRALLPFLARSL